MSREMIDHIIEIKEMMAEMKANVQNTNGKLDEHIELCAMRDAKVDKLSKQVSEAQGAIRIMKWGLPLISAAILGIIRFFKGS